MPMERIYYLKIQFKSTKKRLLLQTKSIALCWTSFYQHINCNFALFALTSSCLCFQNLAHSFCEAKTTGSEYREKPKISTYKNPLLRGTRQVSNRIWPQYAKQRAGISCWKQLLWGLIILGRFLFTTSSQQDPNPIIPILTKMSLHFHYAIGWRTNSCKSFFIIFPLGFCLNLCESRKFLR